MTSVSASVAKAHFFRLPERAGQGERITITRRGEPLAELIPARNRPQRPVTETVAELR